MEYIVWISFFLFFLVTSCIGAFFVIKTLVVAIKDLLKYKKKLKEVKHKKHEDYKKGKDDNKPNDN